MIKKCQVMTTKVKIDIFPIYCSCRGTRIPYSNALSPIENIYELYSYNSLSQLYVDRPNRFPKSLEITLE